jgi:hypothetical protein
VGWESIAVANLLVIVGVIPSLVVVLFLRMSIGSCNIV